MNHSPWFPYITVIFIAILFVFIKIIEVMLAVDKTPGVGLLVAYYFSILFVFSILGLWKVGVLFVSINLLFSGDSRRDVITFFKNCKSWFKK